MKLPLLLIAATAVLTPFALAQTYVQETYESDTVGEKPSGTITFSPSTNTSTNGAQVVDSGSSPANPLSGKSLYLYDLAGDLTTGDPTHMRAELSGGANVSNVRVDFDFRRGFIAIDGADADTRYHFALGRAGDSLNNSDFRPFEIRIVNNGDLVVNSLSGSSSVGTHNTGSSNHMTIMANSHDTNTVAYSDGTLGSGSVAPNTVIVFLNGTSVGTFDFHQTPDPANAPQVDFLAQNEDLGQYAFYQDSKRQGELVIDNLTIAALTAPVASIQAPSSLAASSPDSFTIDLTWTDGADNEGEYRIERKEGSGSFSQIATISANSTSYSDQSVSDGTSYVYRVIAAGGAVVSDPSNEVSIATAVQVAPVIRSTTAPGIVVAGASPSVSVTTAGQGTLSYQWYRGSSGDTSTPIAAATSATLTLPGLSATTTVWVRVTNGSGSVDGDTVTLQVRAAGTTLVTNESELTAAIAAAGAGDSILLADGTWNNLAITLTGEGADGFPISVGAQTAGKVILTGSSQVEISGRYLELRDLVFSGPYTGSEDEVIQFRASGSGPAHDSRVTNISFIDYVPANGSKTSWVAFYGTNNRLDHSYLKGHDVIGVTVLVWPNGEPNDHRIDHNHFDDRKSGGGENGWETIRIGTSDVSMTTSRTLVEHNLFTRVDGEIETISNKTGGNIYRYNTFLETSGTLTLRHGNNCLVDSNFFLGNGRDGTGGIRVIGENHVIVNNHFEDTDVRSGAAITVYAGVDGGALNTYFAANNVTIANNTFVNNQGLAIDVGTGVGSSDRTVLPIGGQIMNNVIVQTGSSSFTQLGGSAISAPTWASNLIFGGSIGSAPSAGFITSDPEVTFDPLRLVSLPSSTGAVVGAATGSLAATALDIEGRTRGTARDLGAFEVSLSTEGLVFGPESTLTTGPAYLSSDRVLGSPNARFVNSSVRAVSDNGNAILTNGFVIGGTGLKSVMVRTVGPGLAEFGVPDIMPEPNVVLFSSGGTELASNAGWETGEAEVITRASARMGAFPLVAGTKDSALVTTLAPGAYTAQVVPGGGVAGTVLVEVYDLTPGSGYLVNQSARGDIREGQAVLVSGFVINGTTSRRALVRCAGPALGGFGVASAISNPELKLFNAAEAEIASNDDWDAGADAAAIATASQTIGAFAFESGSTDSAILVTLDPGVYTAHARGVAGATGTVLLEVYLLDD